MLPRGYLEMNRADLEALDVQTAREVYAAHAEIVDYTMGALVRKEAARILLKDRIEAGETISPAEHILTLRRIKCACSRCRGSGIYQWGACINGRMTHSAPCARCGGDGEMNFDDMRRGRAYDMYAIARAARG